MKILDAQKKGNLIRLYLGEDDLEHWGGDDWNDIPYEHNAGVVYGEYVKEVRDFTIPFDCTVLEACEDWHYNYNSPYSKDMLVEGKAPILTIIGEDDQYDNDFLRASAVSQACNIYLGHHLSDDAPFIEEELSLCPKCGALSHTLLNGFRCGKCKEPKIFEEK